MKEAGELTQDGEAILAAVGIAGRELVEEDSVRAETVETIGRPLISEEALMCWYNQAA